MVHSSADDREQRHSLRSCGLGQGYLEGCDLRQPHPTKMGDSRGAPPWSRGRRRSAAPQGVSCRGDPTTLPTSPGPTRKGPTAGPCRVEGSVATPFPQPPGALQLQDARPANDSGRPHWDTR